jgi:hypothetical protein
MARVGATTASAAARPVRIALRYWSNAVGASSPQIALYQVRAHQCPTATTGVVQGNAANTGSLS